MILINVKDQNDTIVCKGSPVSVFDYFHYLDGPDFVWDIYTCFRDEGYAAALVLLGDEGLTTGNFAEKNYLVLRELAHLHCKTLTDYLKGLGYNAWYVDTDKNKDFIKLKEGEDRHESELPKSPQGTPTYRMR